jgi:glucose 1-dehydrogenase
MRAITVVPGKTGSAELTEVAEPGEEQGPVLVETLAVGVCGTDREILAGDYGAPPPGRERLILGHESLGRVLRAPAGSGLAPGDLVAGIVRRPDPVPCPNCAVGEWDMCRNGRYTEHGIKELDGFLRERYRTQPDRVVKVDAALGVLGVLVEPASVLAKAWEHIERIGGRAHFTPQRALVTGAGPIGLLAALMGVQRGLEVHVLDRVSDGLKPQLVAGLGATYHTGSIGDAVPDPGPDVIVECTGVGRLVIDAMQHNAPGAVVCLTGVSSGGRTLGVDAGAVNREMVLQNDVVFGSFNANRRHYQAGAEALARADRDWLGRLITRRTPLEGWREAVDRQPHDVKNLIQVTS